MATPLRVQALQPADAAALARLWRAQDAAARTWRFHGALDPDRAAWRWQCALAAGALHAWGVVHPDQPQRLLAEACAAPAHHAPGWELALLVDCHWRRHGLGRRLLCTALAEAGARGVAAVQAWVQADNLAMQQLALSLGAVDAEPLLATQAALERELCGREAGASLAVAPGTERRLCWRAPAVPPAGLPPPGASPRWWQRWRPCRA